MNDASLKFLPQQLIYHDAKVYTYNIAERLCTAYVLGLTPIARKGYRIRFIHIHVHVCTFQCIN